jgi:CheY-like chemotaxis protein
MSSTASIVVVEDEAITAKEIEQLLLDMNYAVPGIAKTGEEALALVETHQPDLVLMDIQLKGAMDGVEAARVIRARHDTPIVYLTANADRETVERARATNAFGFIVKPFHGEELRANVEIALSTHQQERATRERLDEVGDVLERVGDAIVTVNARAQATYLNAAARAFANPDPTADEPRRIDTLFRLDASASGDDAEHPVRRALRGETVVPGTEAVLVLRDGRRQPIRIVTAAPIYRDDRAMPAGAVWVFHEALPSNGDATGRPAAAAHAPATDQSAAERLRLIETLLTDLGLSDQQLDTVIDRMRARKQEDDG